MSLSLSFYPPGGHIFLNLPIPALSLQFGKPRGEFVQLLLGRGFNRLFDLLELDHEQR